MGRSLAHRGGVRAVLSELRKKYRTVFSDAAGNNERSLDRSAESRPSCCPRSRDPLPHYGRLPSDSAEAVASGRSDSSAGFATLDRTEPGERLFDELV